MDGGFPGQLAGEYKYEDEAYDAFEALKNK